MQKTLPVIILAGGKGLRMQPYGNDFIPKPAMMLGAQPLVYHVIDSFLRWKADREFLICLGFKSKEVKDCLSKFVGTRKITFLEQPEEWDTGTRALDAAEKIGEQNFWLTYCDGLLDINPVSIEKAFEENNQMALAVAVKPRDQYGVFVLENGKPVGFIEKPIRDQWISAGAFLINKNAIAELLSNKATVYSSLEKTVIPELLNKKLLSLLFHLGNFKSIDTLKDLFEAEELLKTNPFWKN